MKKIIIILFTGLAAVLIGWTAIYGQQYEQGEVEKDKQMEQSGIIDPGSGLANALKELSNLEKTSDSGLRVTGSGNTDPQLDAKDQLRRALLLQLIDLYKQLIEIRENVVVQDAEFVGAELLYDKSGKVSVEVRDSEGMRDDFVIVSNDENIIIDRIAREYGLGFSDVVRKTSFSYKKLDGRVEVDVNTTMETKVRGGKTLITMNTGETMYNNWFDTQNVYEAVDAFTELHRLRTSIAWSLLKNS